jgi:hypothetical protein
MGRMMGIAKGRMLAGSDGRWPLMAAGHGGFA